MEYISSRGGGESFSSKQAIIKGLADDGGLFVPRTLPTVDLEKLYKNKDYRDLAYAVMRLYLTDFTEKELKDCIAKAYDEKFTDDLIAPLVKVEDYYVLELFHGATSAFKDMALSILPHLLTTSMKSEQVDEEVVILTATSGDTGKAALAGFAGVDGTKIIVFYPEHGVSEIQRRQMITQVGENTFVVAVKGNFDDAQTGVKNIFSDKEFGENLLENGYKFSSANSINIGRLVPQIVYYFHAYFQLVRSGEMDLGEVIDFSVPTGNFGNILAGFYAKKMGLPVGKLVVASNDNKVLVDFIGDGVYDKNRNFVLTTSPSMDILVSSNLERLLNFSYGEDETREHMAELGAKGVYKADISVLKDFDAGFATMDEVDDTIADVYDRTTYVADPHTAVAINVSKKYRDASKSKNKMIVLSTASPYKFPKAVMKAVGGNDFDTSMDDFALVEELEKLMNTSLPVGIAEAIKSEIRHKIVAEKDAIKEVVGEILGLVN